jgi:hypothetical protein
MTKTLCDSVTRTCLQVRGSPTRQNIYKVQYKCALYGVPYSAHLYCTLYMFCIGLMMAVLRPKHVALMYLIFHQCVDIHMFCFRR